MSKRLKRLGAIVLVIAIGLLVIYSFFLGQNKEPELGSRLLATADFPSLYPELRWGVPQKDTFFTLDPEGPEQVEGQKIASEPVQDVNDVRSLWNIHNYYHEHLNERSGWEVYLSRFSSEGELIGWKMGNQYFLIGITTNLEGTQGFVEIWHN